MRWVRIIRKGNKLDLLVNLPYRWEQISFKLCSKGNYLKLYKQPINNWYVRQTTQDVSDYMFM
jgi:hypothetical protein